MDVKAKLKSILDIAASKPLLANQLINLLRPFARLHNSLDRRLKQRDKIEPETHDFANACKILSANLVTQGGPCKGMKYASATSLDSAIYPKLIGITRVKNEADFIEYFARHNLKILDKIYIADDLSSDNTTEIINLLNQEGLAIELLHVNNKNARLFNLHGQVMTGLMRHAAAKHYSSECYIFALDADEMILGKRNEVISQLKTLKPDEYGLIKWKTFAPINGGLDTVKSIRNFFKPLLEEQSNIYKVIVPIKHAGSANITMGNHDISRESDNLNPRILDFELGHFPIRSADQIISKALVATHKTHLKKATNTGENYHIMVLADQLRKSDYSPTEKELTEMALNYLWQGNSGRLDDTFDMDGAFPPITLSYNIKRISPIKVLDELLKDIISNESDTDF